MSSRKKSEKLGRNPFGSVKKDFGEKAKPRPKRRKKQVIVDKTLVGQLRSCAKRRLLKKIEQVLARFGIDLKAIL